MVLLLCCSEDRGLALFWDSERWRSHTGAAGYPVAERCFVYFPPSQSPSPTFGNKLTAFKLSSAPHGVDAKNEPRKPVVVRMKSWNENMQRLPPCRMVTSGVEKFLARIFDTTVRFARWWLSVKSRWNYMIPERNLKEERSWYRRRMNRRRVITMSASGLLVRHVSLLYAFVWRAQAYKTFNWLRGNRKNAENFLIFGWETLLLLVSCDLCPTCLSKIWFWEWAC